MQDVPIVLLGWGGVGRAFGDVVAGAGPELRRRYGIEPRIVAIRRSRTQARPGSPRSGAAHLAERPDREPASGPEPDWRPAVDLAALLADARPGIVVQAVPGDQPGSTAAFDQVLAALDAGAHVVTATKSHLVTRWAELDKAAHTAGRAIRVSGATGAALPAGDLGRRGIRALGCVAIRASLNGTSNHVLNELAIGESLDAVLADAVAAGIAEPEPSGDLDGSDAASKLVILANLTWGRAATIADVETGPITAETATLARQAARGGRALRQVATASIDVGTMTVGLEAVAEGDALHHLPGAEKAVEFDCGQAGRIVVSGGRSSPRGAALALLKDVVNLATGDAGSGLG